MDWIWESHSIWATFMAPGISTKENKSIDVTLISNLYIYVVTVVMLARDLSIYPFRPVPIRRHVSWRLAAWGSPLSCSTILLSVQRSRVYNEHTKLTRGALNRQNLARTRYSPSERRNGYVKQPTQRLYNYWEKSLHLKPLNNQPCDQWIVIFKGYVCKACHETIPLWD